MYFILAWRNIWRNKRRTLITVTSIMFAVLLAIFAQSLSEGTYDQMIDNMVRFHTGFIQVQDYRYEDEPSLDNALPYDESFLERVSGLHSDIEYVVPRIETFMLTASEDQTRAAMVLGINAERENLLNELKDRLVEGRFFDPGDETLVLGSGLAGRLDVTVGDTLVLLGQGRFGMTAAGQYRIGGLVDHPITEMNNQIVYLSLPNAQWLLSAEGHITSLLVTPSRVGYTDEVAEALRGNLPNGRNYTVLIWPEMMPELLQGIEFDRAGMYVMLGILYVVIAFGLFGTILTMTLERLREFGVLLSVGMQRTQLSLIVFIETLFISILGVLTGFVISFPIIYYLSLNPIEITGDMADTMLDMGVEPIYQFALTPNIFYNQGLIIFMLALVICLYPAFKIGSLNILEAARK
ncbi:MAG: ABC transporter permease [Balneolales bacterium]